MRALICGGSVAGLAAACRLTEAGWEARVFETRQDLEEGGRAILLQPNGLAALERLGALEPVRSRGSKLSRVSFYLGGKLISRLDYGELRHRHPYAVEIRPQALRKALAGRLVELEGRAPELGCRVISLDGSRGTIRGLRFEDPSGQIHEVSGDLVIGADGPASAVRSELAISCRYLAAPEPYLLGTVGIETGIEEVAIHCGRAYADGVVPLPDGTYFWDRVTGENRDAVKSHDLAGWQEVFSGRVADGQRLAQAIASWGDLTLVEVRPFWAKSRIAGGALLIGDAAGTVHPHAAQGANLALEDANALGDAVADPRADLAGELRYTAQRRERRLRQYVLWSLLAARTYDAPRAWMRPMRRASLAWNRVGPVRRRLMARGAGIR
jgi:2-polyprenyl-6-methoxyphenol hydroxylase-like FAD-dependent oxidoreductase